MPTLDTIPISLQIDQILRGMGADPKQMQARRPTVVEAAAWALAEGGPLLEPRVTYRYYVVESLRHERLKLAGGSSLTGPLIAQHLAPARQVIAILCTIGETLEQVAAEILQEEPLKGLAMDGFGTAAVEALANAACNQFEREAETDRLLTTIPLSPGMLGWPVDPGQAEIFSLLDPGEIGVRLTGSMMMLPRKSVSMVVGVGTDLGVKGRTCDYCNLKEVCRYQDHYEELTKSSTSAKMSI
jgi:hypothetical protein